MSAADGRTVWLRTSVLPLPGVAEGELVGVMTDITDRKRAQEELEESNRSNVRLLAEVKRLNEQLRRENSRMSAELEITKRLQQMILPKEEDLRDIRELDIAGHMEPAEEVGGDYYDVISRDDGIVFSMGDVTGHGLESGVIAIMVQTALRTLLASGKFESHRLFETLNRVIYDNSRRMNCDRNLTLCLLHYRDRLVTISGQHEEVLVIRQNGAIERHDTLNLGFPIGLEQDISPFISESKIPLEHGDVLVACTDGVTEATDKAGAAYGVERLTDIVQSSHKKNAAEIREAVLENLRNYIGGQRLLDDVSLLVIKPAW